MSTHRLTAAERRHVVAALRRRDGAGCHYCRQPVAPPALTLDHVWPASRGGSAAPWNLVLSCLACNQAARDSVDKCPCRRCVLAVELGALALRLMLAAGLVRGVSRRWSAPEPV